MKKDTLKRKMSWGKGDGMGGGGGGSWEEIIAMSENSYYGSNSLLAAGAKCWGPASGPFVRDSQTHI